MSGSQPWTGWVDLIPPAHWLVYQSVMKEATRRGIPFALAGAFATAIHTGRWRDTNDMDVYILPKDRESVVRLTTEIGLTDIEPKSPYDHTWTYRATDGNAIVEAIWAMRNHRAEVDRKWLERSREVEIGGMRVRVTPPEEMIWPKLYVMMRERCDWPDVMNYLYYCASGLDWQHLLELLGEDRPLLSGALAVFSWLSPDRTSTVPEWVWQSLGLQPAESLSSDGLRARSFCTRNWYGPMGDGPLETSK